MGERTCVVTGASSGIGEAFARLLVRNGWNVVLVARRQDRLARLAAELGPAVEPFAADLLDEGDLRRVVGRLRSESEPVDCLLNNAGITDYTHFADSQLPLARAQVDLHISVPMQLTHAVLPQMLRRGDGGILNIASTAGLHAAPGLAAYSASKAALIAFSESLHEETRRQGVRVTCACPGYTRTELQEAAGADATHLPAFLWMTADDVARSAWRAHERGKALVVPGPANALSAVGLRFLPRKAARLATSRVVARVRTANPDAMIG